MEAASENTEFVVLRAPKQDDFTALFDSILSVLSSSPGDCDVAVEAQLTKTRSFESGQIPRFESNAVFNWKTR
jgi:hypothetical protein